jgi:hypothetical protein
MARKTKNTPAITATLPEPFTPYACERLRQLTARRAKEKKGEVDQIKNRKRLEEELAEEDLGPNDKKDLTLEYWECTRAIDRHRANIRWIADQIDETIESGDQLELIPGVLDLGVEPPPDLVAKKKKAGDDGDAGEGEDDDRPVGEPKRAADPDAPAWHRHSVKDIRLPDRAVAALVQAEVFVLGDIAGGKAGRLTGYKGVTPGDEAYVDKVVAAFEGGAKDLASAIAAAEQAVLSTKGRK